MHITKIELENLKTISKFKKEFSGGVYLFTGENEVGKSTLLNLIGTLLTGKRTDNLLKEGEKKGFAEMQVGEGDNSYTVSIRFSEANPRGTLSIQKTGSGLKSNNLSALQSIFNYQDFDAHEFVEWSKTAEGRRKQVDAVRSLFPSKVNEEIENLENLVLRKKEERKNVNYDLRALGSALDNFGLTPDDVSGELNQVKIAELVDEKTKALKRSEDIEKTLAFIKVSKETISEIPEKIDNEVRAVEYKVEERLKQIKELEAKNKKDIEELESYKAQKKEVEKELLSKIGQGEKWLSDNPEIDVEAIDSKINSAESINDKFRKVESYKLTKKELEDTKALYDKLDNDILDALEKRRQIIEDSKLPIEGLDFGDDGLTLNGVPFRSGEVSTSQEMEVAAKLIICKNPTVKVFKIAQGESLGADRLNAIVEFARINGYQGFIEEVRRGQQELVIEEYKEN